MVTIYCLKRSCVGRRKLPVELGSSFGEPFFGLFWFKKDQFAVARIDAALQGAGGLVAGGRRRARNQRAVEGGATGRVSGYKRLGGEGSGLESPPRPFLRTPRGGSSPMQPNRQLADSRRGNCPPPGKKPWPVLWPGGPGGHLVGRCSSVARRCRDHGAGASMWVRMSCGRQDGGGIRMRFRTIRPWSQSDLS